MLKAMLDTAFLNREDFSVVYAREKPQQISDSSVIEKLVEEVIAANPRQVEQFKGGKRTVSAFFVGQVMKASKGQANPALLNELVVKKLDEA
jgi:aspartyl-tRNA(Asn)/glutamyl-tRNA(Gln) amidotransferase subunit B